MAQPSDKRELPGQTLTHIEADAGAGAGVLSSAGELQDVSQYKISSPMRNAIRRYRQNWMAMICLALVLAMVFGAIFAPFLRTTPDYINPNYDVLNQSPSWSHWFGTDALGRDQWTRLLFGLRPPFLVGFVGAAITVMLGIFLGTFSGYYGGFLDSLLSRFTDVMFAFPGFLLALLCVSLFGNALQGSMGGSGRVLILVVVFSIVGWPFLMRFVRSLALGLKEQQFIEAAKVSGSSGPSIIRSHLFPNMWGLVLVQASFVVINTIYVESALSLFGLGVPSPTPDLGVMLFDGRESLAYNAWELVIPATVLGLLIVAGTFVGDGLRDAVDPRGR